MAFNANATITLRPAIVLFQRLSNTYDNERHFYKPSSNTNDRRHQLLLLLFALRSQLNSTGIRTFRSFLLLHHGTTSAEASLLTHKYNSAETELIIDRKGEKKWVFSFRT